MNIPGLPSLNSLYVKLTAAAAALSVILLQVAHLLDGDPSTEFSVETMGVAVAALMAAFTSDTPKDPE